MDGLIERAFQKLQEEEERKHVNFHQLEDKEQAYLKASEQCTLQSEQWTPGSFETDHVGKHISVPSNCLGRSSPCPRDGFWRDWKWPKTVLPHEGIATQTRVPEHLQVLGTDVDAGDGQQSGDNSG